MILCLFIECLQIGDCFVLSVFKYWPLPILYCKYIHERNIHTDLLLLLLFLSSMYIILLKYAVKSHRKQWAGLDSLF